MMDVLVVWLGVVGFVGAFSIVFLVKAQLTFRHTNRATKFIFTNEDALTLLRNNPTSDIYFSNLWGPNKMDIPADVPPATSVGRAAER